MIVVIADDLSGAAELAGAATRLGLSAEVQTRFTPDVPSQVVCVDTGGRMLSPSSAAAGMERMISAVLAARPAWIYLKFDSVLRGNILPELRSALRATGLERALLVTANPGRGRTIRGGDYHVDGVPLHETLFASDPEYPRATSSVRELLGEPADGIVTPDVEDPRDLAALASGVGPDTLTAGSAEFFEALLIARGAASNAGRERLSAATWEEPSNVGRKRHPRAGARRPNPGHEPSPTLLVCGSLGAWPSRSGEARERGIPAFDIHDDPAAVARALAEHGSVLLGIGDRPEMRPIPPKELLAMLAAAAASVTRAVAPGRLLLEGGATAASVIQRLGWTRMISLEGVGEGVGTLRPADAATPIVLIKPGSYPWPGGIW